LRAVAFSVNLFLGCQTVVDLFLGCRTGSVPSLCVAPCSFWVALD
jgi:hypothetical protein